MTHDGANSKGQWSAKHKCVKILLRAIVWHFNTKKLNVALINRIEFQDSKVFTMIVQSSTPRVKERLQMTSVFTREIQKNRTLLAEIQDRNVRDDQNSLEDMDIGQVAEKFAAGEVGESSFLAAYAVSLLLKQGDCDIFLASAFVLHGIIAKHIPLARRRLPIISFDSEFEGIIDEFLGNISVVSQQLLEDPKWSEVMETHEVDCDTMDLVDGRLFRATMQAMCDQSLHWKVPETAEDDWCALHRMVKQLSGQDLSTDGSIEPKVSKPTAPKGDDKKKTEILSVLPFSSPVFDEHLKSIHVTADMSIQHRAGAMTLYRETTHWHNHRKPLVAKASATQTVSKWR